MRGQNTFFPQRKRELYSNGPSSGHESVPTHEFSIVAENPRHAPPKTEVSQTQTWMVFYWTIGYTFCVSQEYTYYNVG